MTKVLRAPAIPKEKSRTVRPVHGPAMIHLPLQGYALPCREASVLSLRYTTDFPVSVPDILSSGCPSVAGACLWHRLDRKPNQMVRLSMQPLTMRVNLTL
jgi:hypothetical protein